MTQCLEQRQHDLATEGIYPRLRHTQYLGPHPGDDGNPAAVANFVEPAGVPGFGGDVSAARLARGAGRRAEIRDRFLRY